MFFLHYIVYGLSKKTDNKILDNIPNRIYFDVCIQQKIFFRLKNNKLYKEASLRNSITRMSWGD